MRLLHDGDTAYEFGRVTRWEPGERLAMDVWLALDREHPTTVAVEFTPRDGGTLVALSHGGWTRANTMYRHKFNEWPLLLERFADHAAP